ncbi:MAG: DUF2975 domain-containing protein [Clostridia bacterium]|nr:DUF2975 domain-containing protein [Clostridia bacterium]
MLKISNKHSVNLSLAISVVFFAVCIAGLFVMPFLSELLLSMRNGRVLGENVTVFVTVIAYLILAVFMLADILLFNLLLRVKRSLVFTAKSVSLIRGVSWCCFAAGILFCCLGLFFNLSFVVGFMGAFLGLCLRVTKNVIAEATEIKSENDLTV